MLVTIKSKRKRSKAMMIILLPVLIFMFVIGWCMYWMGSQKRTGKTQRKPPEKDNVTIMPIIFEETQEVVNE
jgi:flagellar basal body-associated protein FliL